MPKAHTLEYLTSKLNGFMNQRNDALRRVGDARAFYDAQINQLREIDTAIAMLRDWIEEACAEPDALEARTDSRESQLPERKTTVRALIRNVLPRLDEEFTANELVDVLNSIDPKIMRNTVMVELHYFAKRGELQRISTGRYRNIGVHLPVLMETA